MNSNIKLKINLQDLYFVISSLFLFFGIRKYFIIVFPIFVFIGFRVFKLKTTINQIQFSLLLISVTLVSTILTNGFVINYLTSVMIYLSFFFFITSSTKQLQLKNYKINFFKISTKILIFVNIIAFITYFKIILTHHDIKTLEDSFSGLYGKSGLGQHALSIINFMYAAYYFLKKKYHLFSFFIISGLFGFYGLGLLLLFITISIILLINIKYIYKYLIYMLTIGFVLITLVIYLSPRNYNYIKDNVQKTIDGISGLNYEKEINLARNSKWSKTPRKLTFYKGCLVRIQKNPEILLLGTSPGSYNSKTAFLLNGDYSNINFLKNNIKNRHKYHLEDVFPLWNAKIYERMWMDGTRNQPFSSLFSLMMEYGFFIGLIFIAWVFKKIRSVYINIQEKNMKLYILFISIYFGLTSLFLNVIETVDLIFVFLLLFKSIEINYTKRYENRL